FLFPILQLLFFKVLERSRKKMMHKYQILDLLRWIIIIIGGGYVMLHYQGVVRMSAADNFLLGYIERFQENSMLPFQILMECILIGGCALFFFSRKFMMVVFTILWTVVQVNNTTYAYNRVYHYRINSRDFASLSQIEYFIKEHKDETFLMLHDGKNFSESGMNLISDTYFNYANTIYTYTATLKKKKGAKEVGLDLNSYEIPIKKYMRNLGEKNTYDCKHVDYIIMSKDGIEELDETQCEIMPESNYMFVIYRLNDPTMIPRIIEKEGK
ncbi:MAG: hypothetical protein IJ875_02350, partial [Solobacterium sp.]|nr:hypothetical protein [Solobacterium sp.]